MSDWQPAVGQVVLLELVAGGDDCFTGVVAEAGAGVVVVDLGASPRPPEEESRVTASFFSPDALYRVHATLSARVDDGARVDLAVHDVERVQRRMAARTRRTVPLVLSALDDAAPGGGGAFSSVRGESIDLGEGGCRVVVERRFPPGCDPTVHLHLSPDQTVVALAAVLEEDERPDGRYEYRLAFTDPEDRHGQLLAAFIAES